MAGAAGAPAPLLPTSGAAPSGGPAGATKTGIRIAAGPDPGPDPAPAAPVWVRNDSLEIPIVRTIYRVSQKEYALVGEAFLTSF